MRTLRCEVVLPLLMGAALALAGCVGDAGDLGAPLPSGVGRVSAELTTINATGGMQVQSTSPGSKPKVNEIIVTVAKVTAHSSTAGWVTVSNTQVTVDILKLAQYSAALGFANIPAGKVTQVRLYLAENSPQYVTRDDGVRVDLKVPSGYESGIKIKGLFDVQGCNLTNLSLQIDGKKSIWVHPTGQGDLWILRPVIRMGSIDSTTVGCMPPTDPVSGAGGGASGAGGGAGSGTGGGIAGTAGGPGGVGVGGGTGGTGGGTAGTGGGTGGGFDEGPGTGSGGLPGGTTPLGGAGTTCATSVSCLSGVCLGGLCAKGTADSACMVAADCASNVCSAGACAVGTAGGTGSTCTTSAQCMSGGCVNGICGEGGQGQPCAAATDCAIGFACVAGSCASTIN